MQPDLSEKDINLLIILHENPTIRYSELAKILGISPTTIANMYQEIRQKTVNRVVADLDTKRLDLEIIDILIETDSYINSKKVEIFCDEHSYTLFRSRIFGKFNGLFLQFRIPRGTETKLSEQIKELQNEKIIKSFQFLKHDFIHINTKMQLKAWSGTYKWEFDWKEWENKIEKCLNSNNIGLEKMHSQFENSILRNLDKLDMLILEELTIGCARRKNKDIIQAIEEKLQKSSSFFPISKQTFSRRLKFLKNTAIRGYRLFFDWRTFDIHYSIALICKSSSRFVSCLYKILESSPIPFESSYRALGEESFIWYIRIPSSHFFSLIDILWKHVNSMDVYSFNYKSSLHYGLWHKTFQEESHQWLLNY